MAGHRRRAARKGIGAVSIVRHRGLVVWAGVLSLGLAVPAVAADYGTAPATTAASAEPTAATTKTAMPTSTAATTKPPKTGAGPLPEAAGVALLLAGASVLLRGRRRPASLARMPWG